MITFNEDYDVMYLIIYIPWEINKKLGILFNCQAHSSKESTFLMYKRTIIYCISVWVKEFYYLRNPQKQ